MSIKNGLKIIVQAFHKRIRIVQTGLIASLVALAIYLILLILEIPLPYIRLSTLHQFILLNGELLVLTWLYKKYLLNDLHEKKLFLFVRDFLLINCIFFYPFIKFYTNPLRTEIPIIRQIRPYLISGYLFLIIATIFALHRLDNIKQAILWLNHQIDNQQYKDIESEEYRSEQLQNEPGLASIPIFGNLIKKFQRESVAYLIALVALGACGLILRLWQLDGLPPYIDEFNHLNAAKNIYQGLSISQVDYRRSLYVVTLPVVLFFQLFGVSLWAARLAGVLINMLGVIPLYLLCKKINKPVALIAVGLFVFSPWIIAVSRNVREYAYYPLVFYSLALIMTKLYEALPEQIIFQRDYKLFLQRKILFYLGMLVVSLYFAIYVDGKSTLKMLLIFYPAFGILLARKIDWHNQKNRIVSLILLATGMVFLVAVLLFAGGQYLFLNYDIRNYTFFPKLFFESPAQQWYYNRPIISIIIFALALLATPLWNKLKIVLPFALLTFLGGVIAISFFFLKGERPRYAINIELWFIILMATGLFCAYKILELRYHKKYLWVAWSILVLLFWNVPQSANASMYNKSGWHPITEEFHADIGPALAYLQSRISKEDAFVTTGYVVSYERFYSPDIINDSNVIPYDYHKAGEDIFTTMDIYKNGWIVLDYFRGYLQSQPVPFHDFIYNHKQVEYLGWFGNVYILRWDGE